MFISGAYLLKDLVGLNDANTAQLGKVVPTPDGPALYMG